MFSVLRRGVLPALFMLGSVASTPALSADDLEAARQLAINHCSQCHTFDEGQPHGQGPNLFGLIGREASNITGFRFSEGYKEAMQGKVWDAELLDQWLTDTLTVAPKTTMVYWQDDPAIRAALIRFLESLH